MLVFAVGSLGECAGTIFVCVCVGGGGARQE